MSKLDKPQMRPKVKVDKSLSTDKPKLDIKKFKSVIKRNFAILVLAAGFIRMIYLEADNRWIILGIGILLTVALIEWALSRD